MNGASIFNRPRPRWISVLWLHTRRARCTTTAFKNRGRGRVRGRFGCGYADALLRIASRSSGQLVYSLGLTPPANRYVFYLLSGIEEQSEALLRFAADDRRIGAARSGRVFFGSGS